jgi:hypothetical protein
MNAKKLTITVSAEVYRGLKRKIGPGKISAFIDGLARPYVVDSALDVAYREMAADGLRESEAQEWVDGLAGETLKDGD